MTTTTPAPASPAPTKTTTESFIGHWVTFFKAHEKLLLFVLLAAVVWHVGDKIYDAYGQHLSTVQLADNAKIKQIDQQNAQNTADLAALKVTVAAQSVVNQAKIKAAKQQIITVQKIDSQLPLPELTARWTTLVSAPPSSVQPQPNGTVIVTTEVAHETVNQLEELQPLNTQLTATQSELSGCVSVRAQQDTTIAGLNTKVSAVTQARDDDAKKYKHDLRQEYWHGFKHGFIVGTAVTTVAFVAAIIH